MYTITYEEEIIFQEGKQYKDTITADSISHVSALFFSWQVIQKFYCKNERKKNKTSQNHQISVREISLLNRLVFIWLAVLRKVYFF